MAQRMKADWGEAVFVSSAGALPATAASTTVMAGASRLRVHRVCIVFVAECLPRVQWLIIHDSGRAGSGGHWFLEGSSKYAPEELAESREVAAGDVGGEEGEVNVVGRHGAVRSEVEPF